MDKNKIHTQVIRNMIFHKAAKQVVERGFRLYNTGKVLKTYRNPESGDIHVEVRGSHVYDVVIEGYPDVKMASCTCPHNAVMCKHQVAALLHLDDILNGKKDFSTSHSTPREVPLTAEFYEFCASCFSEILDERELINIEILDITPGVFNARISVSLLDEWGYLDDVECVVSLCSDDEGKLWISSDVEDDLYDSYTRLEWMVLEYLTNNDEEVNSLIELMPKVAEERKTALMKRFNFSEKLFKEYVVFSVIDGKIGYRFSKENTSFIDFDDDSKPALPELTEVLEHSAAISSGVLSMEKHDDGSYNVLKTGYVLAFPGKDFNPEYRNLPPRFNMIPIAGKEDKSGTKLSSYIKKIEDLKGNSRLKLSRRDKDAVDFHRLTNEEVIFDVYHSALQEYGDEHQAYVATQKYLFDKFRPLLDYFANCRFLYRIILDNRYFYRFEVKKKNLKPIRISRHPLKLSFKVEKDDYFIKLTQNTTANGKPIENLKANLPFLLNEGDTFYVFDTFRECADYQFFEKKRQIQSPIEQAAYFLESIVLPLSKKYEVDVSEVDEFLGKADDLQPVEKRVYLSEVDGTIVLKLFVVYENDIKADVLFPGDIMLKEQQNLRVYSRNTNYENHFLEEFKSTHFLFSDVTFGQYVQLTPTELTEEIGFTELCGKLAEKDIKIFGINNIKTVKYSPYQAKVNLSFKSGQDWFDVKVEISFGSEQVSLAQVRKAIVNDQKFIKLKDGKLGEIPEKWFEKFKNYFLHGSVKGNEVKISQQHFTVIDDLFENEIKDEAILKELSKKKQKLASFKKIKNVKVPKEVNATLRDYQKEAFKWMHFLDDFNWGGILADDMGLGKTLQILAFLAAQKKKTKKTNLIVVPTSLLFNWKSELEKFTPTLTSCFYHGTGRTKDMKELRGYDLVITTYGTVTNDIEKLRELNFNYIILDESQAIKNPASQRYKAACLLKAKNKLALTGTPIENNTFDLYAQLNFTNPGFLGAMNKFKTDFAKPIDQNKDEVAAAQLQKMIKPFVLRRTKEQVAGELPSKTEDYLYCEMEAEQQKVYDAYRNKYRNFLLKKIDDDGIQKSKLHVLEGLTKLRQICDSPALLSDQEDYGRQSVKIKQLMRYIKEKTSGHKVLVFSQFVQMLKLIEDEVAKEKIDYVYLDGQSSTKQRSKVVNTFQKDENCRVFLISLKAGGQGLNLTAADYVFLVDPWWNPAVENQAIDRCYRIGQDKKVFAYRMICKNTIEEKIVNLQDSKRKIASDIINTEEGMIKNLTKETIQELFG